MQYITFDDRKAEFSKMSLVASVEVYQVELSDDPEEEPYLRIGWTASSSTW